MCTAKIERNGGLCLGPEDEFLLRRREGGMRHHPKVLRHCSRWCSTEGGPAPLAGVGHHPNLWKHPLWCEVIRWRISNGRLGRRRRRAHRDDRMGFRMALHVRSRQAAVPAPVHERRPGLPPMPLRRRGESGSGHRVFLHIGQVLPPLAGGDDAADPCRRGADHGPCPLVLRGVDLEEMAVRLQVPKATGASAYLLPSCLAISLVSWHGTRGWVACCAARGAEKAPQAIAAPEMIMAKRRILRTPCCGRPTPASPVIWPCSRYL
jgi:hypothetical protein